jgi:Asp-tRNA(Asn)/Glu-tRNA(Gln) amidotransferase A subunit family amidase
VRNDHNLSRRAALCSVFGVRVAAAGRVETLSEWLSAERRVRAAALQACLKRIPEEDTRIRAWVQVLPQKSTGEGPLSGIPFGVKDVIETRGLRTEYGSPVYRGHVSLSDAAIVQEFRRRGAVLLGKTHTAAFAVRDPAPTRNPRNLEHTPGGSSSGSAAAVAAGMVPVAIGTQTGGSIVRPASYCGITGFKTTFGLYSLQGVLPYAKSLDTLGFFTHTPADMLRLWEALGRDTRGGEELAFGVPDPLPAVDPAMATAVQRAVDVLKEAGIASRRINLSPMLGSLVGAHRTIMHYEGARSHEQRVKDYGDRLGYIVKLVRLGQKITDAEYEQARRFVGECQVRIADTFKSTPVILVPAATGPAPRGLAWTGDASMNAPWSALGTPALTLPMPVGNSLPLGLQLTAAPGEDGRLLRGAVRVHQILNER